MKLRVIEKTNGCFYIQIRLFFVYGDMSGAVYLDKDRAIRAAEMMLLSEVKVRFKQKVWP